MVGVARVLITLAALLGQRTVVIAGHMLTLIALGSTFWLVLTVLDNPTPLKLYTVAGYAAFMLAMLWIRRRQ